MKKDSDMMWEVLGSRTVIKDRWVDLRADDCRMADGTMIAPFYVNHMPDFVVVAAVTEDNQMIMIRQYRHGIRDVILEVPAGCVEEGETMEEAAVRELLEETGYEAGSVTYLCKTAPNGSCLSNYAHCYLAREAKKTGRQKLDPTEEIQVELYSLEEIREMLKTDKIVQAVHMAAVYRALEVLEGDI